MTLKFDCSCGTRIGFDVEPENGRMPSPLTCPSCGFDLTGLAEAAIATQLAATASARPAMRLTRHEAPAEPDGPSLIPATAPPVAPAASASPSASRRARPDPKPPGFLARNGFRLVGMFATLAIGYWIWFTLVGSKPRPVFHLEATAASPFLRAHLLDRERLLVLTPTRLSLRNIVSDSDLWSAEIPRAQGRKPAALKVFPRSDAQEDPDFVEGDFEGLRLQITGKTAWVRAGNRLTPFDLATGKRGTEIPLPDPVLADHPDSTGWLFISPGPDGQQVLTRVDFATGKSTTVRHIPPPRATAPLAEGDEGPRAAPWVVQFAGTAVVQGRLLEQAITSLKPADSGRPSALEKENLRASDSDAVAGEFLRGSQDYATEDLSRYEVTVRRPFGGTPWKGNVAGRPLWVPLNSLDLLIAGKSVTAFDRTGNQLWQATLGNTVADHHHYDTDGDIQDQGRPAYETSGRVYVLDRGTVHAFNTRSGNAVWRLPTVGATEVVEGAGAVYVATTSAGPEAMNLNDPRSAKGVRPLLLALDPSNGAVRWQTEWLADHAAVSGSFVFGWRAGTSALDELSASMNQTTARAMLHFSRLDPSNGRADWTWHRPGRPQTVEAFGNRILLHRPREILVLGFRTR
jgi:hypothetical protein